METTNRISEEIDDRITFIDELWEKKNLTGQSLNATMSLYWHTIMKCMKKR